MAYKGINKKRAYYAAYNRRAREKRWLSEIVPMNRPWTQLELAWVAGVFEGEGCFSSCYYRNSRSFVAKIAMTDLDVIEKVQKVLNLGLVRVKQGRRLAHHKEQHTWTVSGFEDVQAVMAALWPWMCSRRRVRIKEILSLAKEYFATPASNGMPRNRFRRAKRVAQ